MGIFTTMLVASPFARTLAGPLASAFARTLARTLASQIPGFLGRLLGSCDASFATTLSGPVRGGVVPSPLSIHERRPECLVRRVLIVRATPQS